MNDENVTPVTPELEETTTPEVEVAEWTIKVEQEDEDLWKTSDSEPTPEVETATEVAE